MNALAISKLKKSYGNKPALRGVSLTVEAGEIYGFLGPNGAGKTTTIRCIMDFMRPDGGEIKVLDSDAQKNSVAVKKLIGFLPADNQLYEKWTTRDHINFVTSIRGAANVDKLVKRLDLDPRKQVRHLSTGNKQKVGLILALLGDPKLLILDEPTRGLDPLLQHEIYAILKEYVAGGGTVFLSSHNLAEVEHICSNVGVLRAGEIVASKSMSEILAMNVHIVTASFRGDKKPADLKIVGAETISSANGHVVLKVRGDINPVIAKLAAYELADVEIAHAPLEEIFMEYYRGPS
ncbi:MAG TPA: ABC transporter ATP-binding protein [Candidatus Nanoarchaeia archaeon]|nr:ABC transporter ATP-binding protein [Candidatus Nanoarchaeia archaeon]